MQSTGKAQKVSIYVSEGSTHHGTETASAILDFLFYRGVAGATVLKGVAGFGGDHRLHTSAILAASDHLPMKVEFIETAEKVQELLPKLEEMCGSGMIEVQETLIVKAGSAGKAGDAEKAGETLPHRAVQGKAKLLRVYVGEEKQWGGKPLHEALVEALRANDMAGVTVYRGILGYGAQGTLHEAKMFGDGSSLMLSVVDTEEHIAAFMPVLEKMLSSGLAVVSDVDVVAYRYGAGAAEGEA